MSEKIWIWLAWHLPRPLVYWAAIRMGAHATQDPYSDQIAPDLLFIDALKRWKDDDTHA
jgi:hypothetical protein